MTFTATPQPSNVPPRVRLDVNSDDVAKPFTSLTIYRDGKVIREQPFIGGSAAVVYDYEAPFGTVATYSAVGTVGTFSTLYAETWGSLSGWATASGSPVVTGSHLSNGRVNRALAFPVAGRLVSQGLPAVAAIPDSAYLKLGPLWIVSRTSGGTFTFGTGGSGKVVTGLASPFTVIWDANSATLTSTGGTWTLPLSVGGVDGLLTANSSNTSTFVEDFTITTPTNAAFNATSSTTLAATAAWLIHPSQPSLSIPIDFGPQGGLTKLRFIEASSGESKTSAAQATVHRPVGRRRAVVITAGPRQADEWTLTVGAPTIVQKNAVRAIVDDQTPLLLRFPLGQSQDLPEDWYSVGDVEVSRVQSPVLNEMTLIRLPLTPVDQPIVRQGALWTYGTGLLANPTYADSLAASPTYLDRLAGPA